MSLLDSVKGMLGGQGGSPGAGLAISSAGDLGHLVESCAGSGENASVSADQIKSVLCDEHIAAVEGQLPGAGTDLTSTAGGLLKGFLGKGA